MAKDSKKHDEKQEARDPLLVEIGARIRQIRSAVGVTQKDLGDRAGVSPAYIYLVENGGQNLTITVLARLARALGISIEEILAETTSGVAPTRDSLVNLGRVLEKLRESLDEIRTQDEVFLEKILGMLTARKDGVEVAVRELERLSAAHERAVEKLGGENID